MSAVYFELLQFLLSISFAQLRVFSPQLLTLVLQVSDVIFSNFFALFLHVSMLIFFYHLLGAFAENSHNTTLD
jgi:hypothetical protein